MSSSSKKIKKKKDKNQKPQSKKTMYITVAVIAVAVIILVGGIIYEAVKGSQKDTSTDKDTLSTDKDTLSTDTAYSGQSDYTSDMNPVAAITMEDGGVIEVELYPSLAPNTVNNFIALAADGFYDGLTFHRIIQDFMIQGGDPSGDGSGGPGYSIKGEFTNNGVKNDLLHEPGVISMARSSDNDSAGSQFFIMTSTYPSLDGEYAAFGKVISGMDEVYAIAATEVGSDGQTPVSAPVIKSITIDTKGVTYDAPEKIE